MKISRPDAMAWRIREGAAIVTWFCVMYAGSDWLTGRLVGEADLPSLTMSADLLIPFWPAASWIYLSATPVMILSLFVLREPSDVRALTLAVALEIALAALVYLIMPVEPSVSPATQASAMFRFADDLNLTYNSFPSLHVTVCTTGAFAMMAPQQPIRNAVLLLWAAAIAVSTLVTHQHTIADAAGGLVLAALGLLVFGILRGRLAAQQREV